ncbi:efflux RND transporter permease subunit [Candidatus Akkermansia timonensis]|nr:efflux RND transporter permease subunit [Candidatus Akkermansia timonensis]
MEAMTGVKDALQELSKRFPPGVSYEVSYDPTQYISATMAEIVETLIIALILVVGITYLFLQDWRATLIPALAIPVSLIGTFAILYPLGFSINVLTMFGLILVIGLPGGRRDHRGGKHHAHSGDGGPDPGRGHQKEHAPDYGRHHRHYAGDGGHLRPHRLLRRHGGATSTCSSP